MSAKLKHITGSDSMCDIVPTAPDVSVRLNTIVRRAHESMVTDYLFAQNIRPSRKEEIHAAKLDHQGLNLFGSNAFSWQFVSSIIALYPSTGDANALPFHFSPARLPVTTES